VAADALINLRHPTVGESSGTLVRALALGLPAVVHNFGPSSEYPDDVVLKVPLELGSPDALAATLDTLLTHAELREALGTRAAATSATTARSSIPPRPTGPGSPAFRRRCADSHPLPTVSPCPHPPSTPLPPGPPCPRTP
jgi:hypothetical protein